MLRDLANADWPRRAGLALLREALGAHNIRWVGGAIQKIIGISKVESLCAAANIFVGQSESPLVIRPYLSSLTNINYSATQYALFSSMMLLLPKFLVGYSGKYVDTFGYTHFFTATAVLGLPVLVLVWLASRSNKPPAHYL